MSDISYKIIVGLEIHVQLDTQSKMFCGCALSFADQPNSHVCPVCLGLPGSLPVMNKLAVENSILAGLALNCSISRHTKWDRKSYYYPDLPKNYQISQYDLPLSHTGFIEIKLEDGSTKRIRITRAHLEEDAGKNLHTTGNFSQVDLNRAGTPLLEIVTEPDMNNGQEVRQLAMELQRIVRYLGISQADMQKGHMRFEPNINLIITRNGQEFKTPISEVKNLNSFRALEKSVEFEAKRQLSEFLSTGKTLEMGNKRTYGWDDDKQVTILQREKEEAHDYRYFPDPDLVPVEVDEQWLEEIQSRMTELPLQKEKRYTTEFGLSDYDAQVLTAERATADFFDQAVTAGGDPKRLCNIITQTGLKMANEINKTLDQLGLDPVEVAKLAQMVEKGDINASAANTILAQMAETGQSAQAIAEQQNLLQKSDAGQLETIIDQVLAENSQAVEDVRSGGKKAKPARGFLIGQVMQKSKGTANPKVAAEILNKKLL